LVQRVDQFLHDPKQKERFGVVRVDTIEGSKLRWIIEKQTGQNGPYQLSKYLLEQFQVAPKYSQVDGKWQYLLKNQENPSDVAEFQTEYMEGVKSKVEKPVPSPSPDDTDLNFVAQK